MPSLSVVNLSQYGYVPDASPSTLPPNAFSFVRNWRFNQSGFAAVTPGYGDAYQSIFVGGVELGDSSTNATFLFTWNLPDSLAASS